MDVDTLQLGGLFALDPKGDVLPAQNHTQYPRLRGELTLKNTEIPRDTGKTIVSLT